jgi:hypothetical protein
MARSKSRDPRPLGFNKTDKGLFLAGFDLYSVPGLFEEDLIPQGLSSEIVPKIVNALFD